MAATPSSGSGISAFQANGATAIGMAPSTPSTISMRKSAAAGELASNSSSTMPGIPLRKPLTVVNKNKCDLALEYIFISLVGQLADPHHRRGDRAARGLVGVAGRNNACINDFTAGNLNDSNRAFYARIGRWRSNPVAPHQFTNGTHVFLSERGAPGIGGGPLIGQAEALGLLLGLFLLAFTLALVGQRLQATLLFLALALSLFALPPQFFELALAGLLALAPLLLKATTLTLGLLTRL